MPPRATTLGNRLRPSFDHKTRPWISPLAVEERGSSKPNCRAGFLARLAGYATETGSKHQFAIATYAQMESEVVCRTNQSPKRACRCVKAWPTAHMPRCTAEVSLGNICSGIANEHLRPSSNPVWGWWGFASGQLSHASFLKPRCVLLGPSQPDACRPTAMARPRMRIFGGFPHLGRGIGFTPPPAQAAWASHGLAAQHGAGFWLLACSSAAQQAPLRQRHQVMEWDPATGEMVATTVDIEMGEAQATWVSSCRFCFVFHGSLCNLAWGFYIFGTVKSRGIGKSLVAE